MRTITVNIDESKIYYSASQVLEELGFKEIGKIYYKKHFKWVSTSLYEKDDEQYSFNEMYHYNTSIYYIKLGLVRTLTGDYEVLEEIEYVS